MAVAAAGVARVTGDAGFCFYRPDNLIGIRQVIIIRIEMVADARRRRDARQNQQKSRQETQNALIHFDTLP